MVFATKQRENLLSNGLRIVFQEHILSNCQKKDIFLQAINGFTDHLHLLISLGKDQSIAQVVQLIKGESSFWINRNHLLPYKFYWQDDYFAVSVSESQMENVVKYIENQEEHHKTKSFNEELNEFVLRYGFKVIMDS